MNMADSCLDAAMYGIFINEFLKELRVPLNAIVQYLVGDISQMHGGADPAGRDARRNKALPDDFEIDDSKVRAALQNLKPAIASQLSQAEHVCRVFKEMTKISLWEVVKRISRTIKNNASMSPTKIPGIVGPGDKTGKEIASMTGGNPWPYSLDSYASLNCLVCYM